MFVSEQRVAADTSSCALRAAEHDRYIVRGAKMYRRLGVFLVCGLVWCSVAVGQFRLGVQAGVNYASLTPPEDLPSSVEWKTRPGVMVGAIAEIPLGGRFFLQAEPRYIEKGFKYEAKGKFHTATVIETITYLDISLLLKARLADSSFRPF